MHWIHRPAPAVLAIHLATFATFATLALAGPARSQDAVTERKVTVSGTAVTRVAPDIVVWRITTTDQSQSLLEAKDASDRKLRALLGLKEALGVDAKDVQTGHLHIGREYERSAHGTVRTFKQFAVTRRLTLKQRDVSRFDEFLTRIVTAAEVEVDFSLESTRFHDLRMQTRLDAVKVARAKAEAMAKALGATLGPVIEIREPEGTSAFLNYSTNVATSAGGSGPADAETGTFAPGAIEIRVRVELVLALQ